MLEGRNGNRGQKRMSLNRREHTKKGKGSRRSSQEQEEEEEPEINGQWLQTSPAGQTAKYRGMEGGELQLQKTRE